MYYAVIGFYVLVCLTLSLVILLQQGRGGDIASAFGGNSSQAAFGARAGATVLTKATAISAVLFMLLALSLAIIGRRDTGSVVSGTPAPPPPAQPAATPPAAGTPPATAMPPATATPPAATPAAPAAPAAPPPAAPATPAPAGP